MGKLSSSIKRKLGVAKTKLEQKWNRRDSKVKEGLKNLKDIAKESNVDSKTQKDTLQEELETKIDNSIHIDESKAVNKKVKNSSNTQKSREDKISEIQDLLDSFKIKFKDYERKYNSSNSDIKSLYTHMNTFEKLYKDNKIILAHCEENLAEIKNTINKKEEKLENKIGGIFYNAEKEANKMGKITKAKESLGQLSVDKIKECLKNLRKKEKELFKSISDNKIIATPPSQLESKFNTIKKNLSEYSKMKSKENLSNVEDKKNLDSILNKARDLNSTLKIENSRVSDVLIKYWRAAQWCHIKSTHEYFNNCKDIDTALKLFNNSSSRSQFIESTPIDSDYQKDILKHLAKLKVSDNTIPSSKSNMSYFLQIGLIHGAYQKMYQYLKEAYEKLKEVKKELRSRILKGLKILAILTPGLLGLLAGVTGFFDAAILVYISTAGWLACQSGYTTQEIISAANS